MKTVIAVEGRSIAAEQICLEPKIRTVAAVARLGPNRTWATFYVCRAGLEPAFWLDLEQHLRDVVSGLQPRAQPDPAGTLWGISTLPVDGLAIRCAALSGRDVLSGLQSLWRAAKLCLYGREPILPRKVH